MSKVTDKFQITIPKPVREALNIIPGGEVTIIPKGNDFILKVKPIEDLKRVWRGRFKNEQSTDEYMGEIRGVLE